MRGPSLTADALLGSAPTSAALPAGWNVQPYDLTDPGGQLLTDPEQLDARIEGIVESVKHRPLS